MPVLNEAERLTTLLQELQALRGACELIVADGGSTDRSPTLAEPLVDKVVLSPRGRAKQMNAGAALGQADILLFLHADTQLPDQAVQKIVQAAANGYHWGRFDVQFDSQSHIFRVIAFMMNWRSRLTGLATGDQAIFMTRKTFNAIEGFPDIALMEDIAASKRLKKISHPCCLRDKVTTSARRWQQHGVLKTILLMWRLRLAYFFGADPNKLATQYYRRS